MSPHADEVVHADRSPTSRRTAASLSLSPGLVLAATILGAQAWWMRTDQPTLAAQSANAWAVFAAVLIFAALAYRARRWLALPLAVWGALALGLSHAYTAWRPVRLAYAVDVENRVDYARQALGKLDRDARDVAVWRAGGLPARSLPYKVSGANLHFPAGLPIGVPIFGSTYGVMAFEGPLGSNRLEWDMYGAGWARTLPSRRAEVETELAAYRAGLAAPPLSIDEEVRRWALESVELLAALLAFNGIAAFFGGVVDSARSSSGTLAAR